MSSADKTYEETTERVLYSGRVQGVGFRYTVRSIAKRHPVRGYVKNLSDGRVEVVAQGPPAAVDDLLAEVASEFEGNIADCERRAIAPPELFTTFEIRF